MGGDLFCRVFKEKTVVRRILMGHAQGELGVGIDASMPTSACELPAKVGRGFLGEVDV